MKCYNCGGFLYEGDKCSVCGADVSLYREIVQRSNTLYNRGLEYARCRNLSMAVQCLKVSVKIYKNNINARNLLGLIYYETGEFALALSQWILSKNIQPDNNLANEFIDVFQKSKEEVDKMNSSIKKYNKAIYYIGQQSYDLAEIQLKKLLNDNMHIVKGHQLLALLLIRKNKLAEARVALKKAEKIDAGNATTIAYQACVNEEIKEEEKDLSPVEIQIKRANEQPEAERAPLSGDDVIIPKSSYKEHNPTTMTIIQIIIGLVIGAAIVFFIVVPAKTSSYKTEIANIQSAYESEISTLEAQVKELESQKTSTEVVTSNENLTLYQTFLSACNTYIGGDVPGAAQIIYDNKDAFLAGDDTIKSYYNSLGTFILNAAGDVLWDQAEELYNNGDYAGAAEKYAMSYNYNNANEDSLYYAGVSYRLAGNTDEAKRVFQLYLEKFPTGSFVVDAQNAINEMG